MSEVDRWEDCPPGAVTGMVDRLRRQRQPSPLRPAIGAFLVVVLLGAGYAMTSGLMSGPNNARLNCGDVIPLLAQYHDGTLNSPTAQQVEEHLSHCPGCKEKYKRQFPGEAHRGDTRSNSLVAAMLSR
jgi:hypothetical protein